MLEGLQVRGLTRQLGDFRLGPIDLDLAPGHVVGLLGRNGSGKTSLIRALLGLIERDRGTVRFNGQEVSSRDSRWLAGVGYAGDDAAWFERFSGKKNLALRKGMYPTWDDDYAVSLAHKLDLPLNKTVRSLSKGNRAKLALVAAMAFRPKLLLLDEPNAGLDPVVREVMESELRNLLADGDRMVLYATHYPEEIESIVDELVLMSAGKMTMHCNPTDLDDLWRQILFRFEGDIGTLRGAVDFHREGSEYRVITSEYAATIAELHLNGATIVAESRLTLGEVAVWLLKGGD